MQNPYAEILTAMQRQGASTNPPGIKLAEIVAPPPNIVIKMGDLQVDKDNIYIADYLLPGYKREMESASKGDIISHDDGKPKNYSPYIVLESLTHSGDITLTDTLTPGATVAVLPTTDGQTYIILARVVSMV